MTIVFELHHCLGLAVQCVYKYLNDLIFKNKLGQAMVVGILGKVGLDDSMVQCTHFVSKLEVDIVSKIVTHKISLILDFIKNHIQVIWDLKLIRPII